jgi:hypothetical protein
LTRVTVCDPMYRCWACGQDIRPLIILPLIIARHFLLKCLYQARKVNGRVVVYYCIGFTSFYDFCIGFWNCTDSVVSLFFILLEKGYYTKSSYFLQVMNSAQCKIIYVKSGTFSMFIVCHPKCFINNYWKTLYCQSSCFPFTMNDMCSLQ